MYVSAYSLARLGRSEDPDDGNLWQYFLIDRAMVSRKVEIEFSRP